MQNGRDAEEIQEDTVGPSAPSGRCLNSQKKVRYMMENEAQPPSRVLIKINAQNVVYCV